MEKPNVSHLPYPQIGDRVRVVQKKDYETGKLTEGIVGDILTKRVGHPRGTKVRLKSGVIGRIQGFCDQNQSQRNEFDSHFEPAEASNYFEDEEVLV